MKRFKVKDKNGIISEYISEQELNWTALGLGEAGEYSVEVTDISYEYDLAQCIAARKAAYPSPEEFMNAYFDGGEQAIEVLRHIRLTIKAAHPKPVKE
jgi:hypothetical protein